MLHRVRALVTVITLALPAVAAAQGAPQRRHDPVSTFLRQDRYTYCDAKILGALWKHSVRDAKARIGVKLQTGNEPYLTAQLERARANARRNPRARCTFGEAGFSYDDVAKLAKLWRMSAADAKALAEDKILDGNEAFVRELVRGPAATAADPVATFLQQDTYTYCDVKLLAARWRASIGDAKARVGVKLQTGNEAYLAAELAVARRNPSIRCSYAEAGFSYADVETLAKRWRMSVGQTKVQIEQKVRAGNVASVRAALGANTPAAADPVETFLQQDRYAACDVKLLAARWRASAHDAKARIGAKLQRGNAGYLEQELAAARRLRGVRCSYVDGGFSYADVETLARRWQKSVAQTKVLLGDKVRAGHAQAVRQTLAAAPASQDPVATFLRQDRYTYCDAKMIAGMWKQSVRQAKAFIGSKVALNSTQGVDRTVAQARTFAQKNRRARCQFHEAGLGYEDALVLAKIWAVSTAEAKALAEEKIAFGHEANIHAQLAAIRKPRPAVHRPGARPAGTRPQ